MKILNWMKEKRCLFLILLLLPLCTKAQITGTHLIGVKQPNPYRSLSSIENALKKQGVAGDLVLLLEDEFYQTEPLDFSGIPGMGMSSSITIKPASGVKTVVELTSGTELISITSIGRFTICGSFNEQDTTHCLTLKAENCLVLSQAKKRSLNERLEFLMKNCVLDGEVGLGFYSSWEDNGILQRDSISCLNSQFKTRTKGLIACIPNLNVADCIFDHCLDFGINVDLPYISKNGHVNISHNLMTECSLPITILTEAETKIANNRIQSSEVNNDYAVSISNSQRVCFFNNTISGNIAFGLDITASNDKLNTIEYNTFSLKPRFSSSWKSYASGACVCLQSTNRYRIQNNILKIDDSMSGSSYRSFILFSEYTQKATDLALEEAGNAFDESSTSQSFGFDNVIDFPRYSDWIRFSGQPSSSKSENQTFFVSESDLHLSQSNDLGIPIPEITTDIEGHPRDPLHPDAGAYEYKGNTEIQADFTFQNTCQPTIFTFTNASSFTSPIWDFGDGQTSTLASPSHNYTTTGTYTVSLTATNSSGQTQKVNKTVSVYARPTAPVIKISGGR